MDERDRDERDRKECEMMAPTRSGDALKKAARVGGIIGSCLLIPPCLAVFVMGRDPNGDGSWGWGLGSVLSGVGLGTFYGFLIGGGIGAMAGTIQGRLRRGGRIGDRKRTPIKSDLSEL